MLKVAGVALSVPVPLFDAEAPRMALDAKNMPLVRVRRTRSIVTVWFWNFLSICMKEGNYLVPITNVPHGNNFEIREYRNGIISKRNISVR